MQWEIVGGQLSSIRSLVFEVVVGLNYVFGCLLKRIANGIWRIYVQSYERYGKMLRSIIGE